ncbi:MAG: type II secretion system protein GspE, partial [Lachnospiraceae bacterium]|nr:type II secretion system protein GspE [Lachnospiraceae bacterium]
MAGLRKKIRIGDMLVDAGVITPEDLQRGLELQKKSGRKLGETLVEEGIVNDETLATLLAEQLGMEMVDIQSISIPEEVLNLVPQHMLRSKKMIPYAIDPGNMNVLLVAMADPMDFSAMDDISIITNYQVEPAIATQQSIMVALDRLYGGSDADEALEQYVKEREQKESDVEEELLNEDINNSPIVVLVNEMIEKAVRQRASDIHIEALERKVRIR